MLPILLLILTALIQSDLVASSCGSPWTSPLYPYNCCGDNVQTDGDDGVVVSYTGTFNFFGAQYTSVNINTNGPCSFDQPYDLTQYYPFFMEIPTVPFFTAFWSDIDQTNNDGKIYYRKSTDPDDIALAAADIARIGSTSSIDYIIVATWKDVEGLSTDLEYNTFQAVLVVADDGTMYNIFNYEQIEWGDPAVTTIGFNQGSSQNLVELSTSGNPEKAPFCGNVGIPGRVVTRVDQASLTAPVLGCTNECTATTQGSITAYALSTSSLSDGPTDTKVTFTSTPEVGADPCKFSVRLQVDDSGNIEWVVINLGNHPNPDKYSRSYAFDRHSMNTVRERGWGVDKRVVSTTDGYEWTSDDRLTSIKISGDSDCWTLESTSGCGYVFQYGPTGGVEPVLRASVIIPDSTVTAGVCGQIP